MALSDHGDVVIPAQDFLSDSTCLRLPAVKPYLRELRYLHNILLYRTSRPPDVPSFEEQVWTGLWNWPGEHLILEEPVPPRITCREGSPLPPLPSDFSDMYNAYINDAATAPASPAQPAPAAPQGESSSRSISEDKVGGDAKAWTCPGISLAPCAQSGAPLSWFTFTPASAAANGHPTVENTSAAGPSRRMPAQRSNPRRVQNPREKTGRSSRDRKRTAISRGLSPLRRVRAGTAQAIDDASDGESGEIPHTPPHHTRPGPSRRMAALRPQSPPIHHQRVHKPKGKSVLPTGDGRRPIITLSETSLARIRGQQAEYLEGRFKPRKYDIRRPVQNAKGSWKCSFDSCTHGGAARKGEAERHMQTHYPIHLLCKNAKCPKLFARTDSLKRHIDDTSCRKGSATTVGTETLMVVENEMGSEESEGLGSKKVEGLDGEESEDLDSEESENLGNEESEGLDGEESEDLDSESEDLDSEESEGLDSEESEGLDSKKFEDFSLIEIRWV
ncbi:hypothetical protein JB92DRAFT_3110446 [Gautieria morchelliformis]|nr:hypothetical protein JB92DRAFT_3110446 [Gautieria morchelliformis]